LSFLFQKIFTNNDSPLITVKNLRL